jgi:hypothetical protein
MIFFDLNDYHEMIHAPLLVFKRSATNNFATACLNYDFLRHCWCLSEASPTTLPQITHITLIETKFKAMISMFLSGSSF